MRTNWIYSEMNCFHGKRPGISYVCPWYTIDNGLIEPRMIDDDEKALLNAGLVSIPLLGGFNVDPGIMIDLEKGRNTVLQQLLDNGLINGYTSLNPLTVNPPPNALLYKNQ